MSNSIKDSVVTCSKLFMVWFEKEKAGEDFSKHDEELEKIFIFQILLKKFKVFGINIILPDPLLAILAECTNCNPGQTQVILKDLLNHIKKIRGAIPDGYVITSTDFASCFPISFPIIEIPEINAKYESMWIGQKIETTNPFQSDNLCDTPEWWKEVME